MKNSFKKGDKVKCIDDGGHNHLRTGKTYNVTGSVELETQVEDDSDTLRWYNTSRFELISSDVKSMDLFDSITYAQTLVGKTFSYGKGRVKTTGSHVKVYLDEKEFKAGYGSLNAQNGLKEYGFSVCIHGNNGMEYPIRDIGEVPTSITKKLTDDYDVTIYADRVEVGCQTIPKSVLADLLFEMQKL